MDHLHHERLEEITQGLAAARAALDAGRDAEAIALLETLVARAPELPELHTLLARARDLQAKQAALAQPRAQSVGRPTEPVAVGTGSSAASGSEPPLADRVAAAAPAPAATIEDEPRPRAAARSIRSCWTLEPDEPTPAPAPAVPAAAPRRSVPLYGLLALGAGLLVLVLVSALGLQRSGSDAASRATIEEVMGRRAEASQDAPALSSASLAALPVATEPAPAESAVPAEPSAADLFAACEDVVGAADWDAAVGACERVRDADADYPGLAGALAATYLHLGRAELENGAPAAAIALFDAVLAHEPYNQVAAEQRDLALAYLEGEAALDAGNWPLAATKLQEVHDLAPDYLEGTGRGGVKEKLYAARLRWGQALLEQRVYAAAASFCAQAAMLVPTGAEAVACRDAAGAALAPAPTEGG